jgi:hypothetical protein
MGGCVQGACDLNFHDVNAAIPGCEYGCVFSNGGVEICDGLDNDCDGLVDDDDGDVAEACPENVDDGSVCSSLFGTDAGTVPTWEGVCDASQGFLERGGGCYYLVTTSSYWADARASCAGAGGHLVTMTSQAEADALEDLGALLFLGACDADTEGTWAWVTGETWDWTDWRPGEPNDLGSEDCLQGDAREPHWFNDTSCGAPSPWGEDYLCEFE